MTMTSGVVVAVTAAGTAIPEVIRKLHAAAGMSVRAPPAVGTAMRTSGGAPGMPMTMTTGATPDRAMRRVGSPARALAHGMMRAMTSSAAVAVMAAGTAIPEVIRKLRAAAGMSERALPALATVMRTTTGGARGLARCMKTTMMSGAVVAVTAAGSVIPKVIQKLHAAGADSPRPSEERHGATPGGVSPPGGGEGLLSATDRLFNQDQALAVAPK